MWIFYFINKTNVKALISFLFSLIFLVFFASVHAQNINSSSGEGLCALDERICNDKNLLEEYKNKIGRHFKRKISGHQVDIPANLLSPSELFLSDEGFRSSHDVLLEVLYPDFAPKEINNIRDFSAPYSKDLLQIKIGELSKGAILWEEVVDFELNLTLRNALSPIEKVKKFGLKIYGEDYKKNSSHIRCPSIIKSAHDGECGRLPAIEDVLISESSPRTILLCDPDEFPDAIRYEMELSPAERESYFKSMKWKGLYRASCRHKFYSKALNSHITITYAKVHLSQWKLIEAKTRKLLESLIVEAK